MMTTDNLCVIIPSYNTLGHLKNTYNSVRKYYPTVEVIMIDDASEDGTSEWMRSLVDDNLKCWYGEERLGHTFYYDEGVRQAGKDVITILHSDMIVGPNYFENMLKHMEPGIVVCSTRVEPPIHPAAKEKIVMDFGTDYDDFQWDAFEKFCLETQGVEKDRVTSGIFAPWMLYKTDYLAIGGHDQGFAPYGYEDSDIFNRWILQGYNMVQSRDALVYHLTCRGHRWNKGVGIENDDYKETMDRGQRHFIRKWNQWIQNDDYSMPIIYPKYDTCLVLENVSDINLLYQIEPWANHVHVDNESLLEKYIISEQPRTKIDLRKRITIGDYDYLTNHDVIVKLDCNKITQDDFQNVVRINLILHDIEQELNVMGDYELGNITVSIKQLRNIVKELIQ